MNENQFASPQPPVRGDEDRGSVSPGIRGTALARQPSTDTEKPYQLFEEEVGRLLGVLRVERWAAEGLTAPSFHVYLRPDDRDTEFAVYEAKGQVYDRYPEAYLDVVVLEPSDPALTNSESIA